MDKKAILLLLLVGTAFGSMALWLCTDEDGIAPQSSPDGTTPVAEDATVATAGAGGPVDATATQGSSASNPTRDAVATTTSLLPIPDDAKWIEVRIVEKATGAPLPDADVAWVDGTIHERLNKEPELLQDDSFFLWRDPELLATRFGWHTKSNAQGIARIHQTESTSVTARIGTLYGHAAIGSDLLPPRNGHQLELEPDFELQAQVLDANGAPAIGVPIALAMHGADGKFQRWFDWGPLAVTKAPQGIACVRHVQSRMRGETLPKGGHWRVRTHLPGFDDPGVQCQLSPPPTEPIVLRLPPCGRVLARVEVPGRPVEPRTTIVLRGKSEQKTVDGNSYMFFRSAQRIGLDRRIGPDGWAIFDHVPLGASYTASAGVFGGSLSKTFTGPVATEGEVRAVLTPGADQILLAGRLLDYQRTPLREQRFRLSTSGKQVGSNIDLRTDAEGRFLGIAGVVRKENIADAIKVEVLRPGEATLVGQAAGRELRAGTEDLGDLVVQPDALLAAGHFLVDGKPCKLRHECRIEQLTSREAGQRQDWRRAQGSRFHQDDAGRFEIRSSQTQGRFRIVLQGSDHLPHDPIEFTAGATNLVIELQSGPKLAATMLVPKGPTDGFQANLIPETTSPPPPPWLLQRLSAAPWHREDGRLQAQWPVLAAGSYRLDLLTPFATAPIHSIDNVQLPVPPSGDPRLVDIDLRSLLRVQTIRVFDQNGKPVRQQGALFPLGQDPSKDLVGSQLSGAETQMLLPRDCVDLMLAVTGFQPRDVRCSGEAPLDVRLLPWPTLIVTVLTKEPLPAESVLQVGLRPQNAPTRNYRAGWNSGSLSELTAAPLDRKDIVGGKAELSIGEGAYDIQLWLKHKDRRNSVEIPQQTVVFSSTGQVVLEVAPEAMAKAIEATKERPK